MGGGPGGDGRDDKDKKVWIPLMPLPDELCLTSYPAEGQAQIRAPSTTYHSHRKEEAQGRGSQHGLQATRHLSHVEM